MPVNGKRGNGVSDPTLRKLTERKDLHFVRCIENGEDFYAVEQGTEQRRELARFQKGDPRVEEARRIAANR